ncbi:unnamed protein product [Vitrella brassicaformis CCMP3155]|uniref:Uncharacterized protein n=2 Tax=Vitrella brassicaformis TaxID=1169539 RepID=A0A0G4ECI7_VITBC|nr:unnamed protein product [Vitrella brassicaformis CCMP3155]|mmetsp:Transcript_35281/g.87608  ORF Transcript_35281/g.87608 Transcript_35281/m.87608 type:complete len:126 (+) Transcript_35281:110-487(+)|eukprot:CEL93016.1 unnamed protein product [Vitrella brassicaformis CCMP3155]
MTYHLGNMSIADTRKYILPQYKIMTSFWQNMHSLLAPRGMVVVNNVPGFFEGHACECEKPIKGTVCSPQESLSVDLCFLKKDQAKSLLFKRFIELTEETGLKLTTPAFFNKKRKIGVGLQRVPLE